MVDWLPAIATAILVFALAFVLASASVGQLSLPPIIRTKLPAHYRLPTTDYHPSFVLRPSSFVRKIELPLLLLLAPLFLFSSPFSVLGVAIILALWVGRFLTLGYFLPRTPLDWPLALMGIMIPVGMLVSPNMDWSVGRAEILLYGIALYYAIVAWINSPARLDLATLAYLLAGGLMAVLSLLGTAWQYKLPVLGDLAQLFPQIAQRLSRDSTGFHPNIVAGALLWIVMPLLPMFIDSLRPREKEIRQATWYSVALHSPWLLGGLLLLTGGTLVLTQSRGALLGAAAGVGLLVWIYWPRLRLAVAALGVTATVIIVLMLGGWWSPTPPGEVRIPTPGSTNYEDSFVVRLDSWKSGLKAISEYPITGIGLDAFHKLMPTRYPEPSVPNTYDIGHAHNQILQAAVDLGLPGAIGYLAVWITAFWMIWGRKTKDERLKTLDARPSSFVLRPSSFIIGIAAALLASFVHGLGDVVVMVSKPGIFFWALLALLTAWWRLTGIRRDPTL